MYTGVSISMFIYAGGGGSFQILILFLVPANALKQLPAMLTTIQFYK